MHPTPNMKHIRNFSAKRGFDALATKDDKSGDTNKIDNGANNELYRQSKLII